MEDSQLGCRRNNQYFFPDHPKLHRVVDKTTDECIDYFLRFKLSFGKKVLNVKLDWKAEAAETTATN